ncbi:MAG: IS1634 family transposase [Clostridiales bacterium]|jgi:transposase|nr:IS1634 family transposase [Clostridiales bacterium]
MIKKEKKLQPNGSTKTFIRVVEGYRPGPGLPPKQRAIRAFGYLEDQQDPAAFMDMVKQFNATYKNDDSILRIELPQNALMYCENNRRQNYGYKFLEAVYNILEIDSFINRYLKSCKFRGLYSPGEIFKFLVFLRILNPASKRASCQLKNGFYGWDTSFSLQDVYRSLGNFTDFEVKLQRHLNERVKKVFGRDLSHAFYDVTNYFFEIDFPDGKDDLRQKGVSKEHRVDPIVSMGLFMDSNGLPVSMGIFPGNTSESITLRPAMSDIKQSYELGRLTVVADKGLNSSKNIDTIVNAGDGFVFSQILRGKKGQRYHTELFNETGWVSNADGTYWYKLFEEEYNGKDKDGKTIKRKRKVLLYWSKSEAECAVRKRNEKLEKAAKAVKNNASVIKKGVDEYLKDNIVDRKTGKLLENVKNVRTVNTEKAEADEKFDGYFCIITSELDYDEQKIRQVYGGLWKIEQSFRLLKSDLYARPVFVKTNEHIRAHFLICFVALLVIRIIQLHMGQKTLSTERIVRALNLATCQVFKGGLVHLDDVGGAIAFRKIRKENGEMVDSLEFSDEDEIAIDYRSIQEAFDVNFYTIYIRQEVFNKFLKSIVIT